MKSIKLWIDDERVEPKGWVRASTCPNAIALIAKLGPQLTHISFDYDIGFEGNGAVVAQYLRDAWSAHCISRNLVFNIHSGNPTGSKNIQQVLEELCREWDRDPNITTKDAMKMWEEQSVKKEWSSFAVGAIEVMEKSARECAYDYFARHGIARKYITLGKITYTMTDDESFFYEVEVGYNSSALTEAQLAHAGIGDR